MGIIVVLLLLKIQVIIIIVNNIKALKNETKQIRSIAIDKIVADKQQHLINIQCTLFGKEQINALKTGNSDIQVSIRKKETTFNDAYIKHIDTLSENTLLLSVQPPLKDALYGMEKRDIIVQFKTKNETISTSKTAILGTATKRLDLRAYSTAPPSKYVTHGILLFLGISAASALALPILKKYNVKKHSIKKYKDITAEDKAELDPFTFEAMEEKDEVVTVNNNIILLRSWKRLKRVKEEDRSETFNIFFEKTEKSHLLKPITEVETKINRIWFGMTGAYIAWLFYLSVMHFDLNPLRTALSVVFNTPSKQYADVIYNDLLLALTLGMGIGIAFLTADRIYGNSGSLTVKTLYRFASGLLILIGCFLLQALITIYLINNSFFGHLIAWICIGIGLALSFGTRKDKKKNLITGSITGLVGFSGYMLCSLNVFINTLYPETILLISLLLMGSMLGGLTYTGSAIPREVIQDNTPDIPDHDNIPAVQAKEL
ncbi:MAG: hypothetical protein AAF934_04595 [Bacteroidota bacterium]